MSWRDTIGRGAVNLLTGRGRRSGGAGARVPAGAAEADLRAERMRRASSKMQMGDVSARPVSSDTPFEQWSRRAAEVDRELQARGITRESIGDEAFNNLLSQDPELRRLSGEVRKAQAATPGTTPSELGQDLLTLGGWVGVPAAIGAAGIYNQGRRRERRAREAARARPTPPRNR